MNPARLRAALAQSIVVGVPGPECTPALEELVGAEGLGGVILFARNVVSPTQVWELNYRLRRAAAEAGRSPLLVMVDQEGGSVARLHAPFTDGPDMAELGRGGDPARVQTWARRLGRELVAAGFNWNLAPVLDVHARADGVMALRSLGVRPTQVAELGAACIRGFREAGCLSCAKHFPGLGRTSLDTHSDRPLVGLSRGELEAVELVPFRRAAAEGVDGVMVCHAVFESLDPARPASLSPAVITGLLRGELGYKGLVLSDDLEMGALAADLDPVEAALQAYLAGCDLVLICHRSELGPAALERLVEAFHQGLISQERVEATLARLRVVKRGLEPLPPDLNQLARLLENSLKV